MSVNEKILKAIEIAKKNGIKGKFRFDVVLNTVHFIHEAGVYCSINIKSGVIRD